MAQAWLSWSIKIGQISGGLDFHCDSHGETPERSLESRLTVASASSDCAHRLQLTLQGSS